MHYKMLIILQVTGATLDISQFACSLELNGFNSNVNSKTSRNNVNLDIAIYGSGIRNCMAPVNI